MESAAAGAADATRIERALGNPAAVAYAIGGLTYPIWSLAGSGPHDPRIAWWIVGGVFLLLAGAAVHLGLRSVPDSPLTPLLAGLSTLHFFLLASANDMMPFYAVGSTMSVFVTAIIVRSPRAIAIYGAFVGVLGLALFVTAPDMRKLAYWLGPLPTLAFAHQRLRAQLALEHELEEEVSERTRQLTDSNQRLRGEIDRRTRLEDQLRGRHKAEAVGRLAGGVAHDFNNILTTIGVYAELIEESLPDDSPLREEVARIRRAQLQASNLTQQLLTLGRRSPLPTERLDLGGALRDLASLLRHMLGDHDLVLRLHEGPLPIQANLDQLQHIAINLVLNARDAMEEPGRLTIETSLCEAADVADRLLSEGMRGRFAVLVAEDTGVGMTPETRERAFDPFFSTKGPGRGSGLGLSTLHGVVSQAGGAVHLESQPGRGARFELYWPLAGADLRARGESPAPLAGRERASILLVEDEEPVRTALQQVLANAGHEVTAAADGQQALAWMSDPGARCDLVITDVVMPRMSGLELARSLATSHPDVRVILISGHLNDRAMQDWDESFPFLAKPFAPSDLMRKVREVLAAAA